MTRSVLLCTLVLLLGLGLWGSAQDCYGQADLTWSGGGDPDFSWSNAANWDVYPEPQYAGDSLKFAGTTGLSNTNDFDPVIDGVLELGLGTGTNLTSGCFHFLDGSGDFVINGNGVIVGPQSQHTTLIRAEASAGSTQTFNIPLDFGAGVHERRVAMLNNGTVIFNGDIDFSGSQMFLDEAYATVVLNGNNSGIGRGNSIVGGTNHARATVRVQDTIANAGTEIILGSDTALGGAHSGSWETGDLEVTGIQFGRETYLGTNQPGLDLSEYYFHLRSGGGAVGGAVNYRSQYDATIGWVVNAAGNRDMKVGDDGNLTIAHGIFMSHDQTARQLNIKMSGSSGDVAGANGVLVVNGPLYNTFVDPTTGGITTQRTAVDGSTMVNGTLRVNYGAVTLNGDSSTTWVGSEYRAINGSRTILGSDGALGDSTSIVDIDNGSTIDLNGHTIAQTFEQIDGDGVTGTEGALVNSSTSTAAAVTSDFHNVGSFGVGGDGDIELQNVYHDFSVNRNITKWGNGTLTLSGSLPNNRYGLIVNGGTVNLNKTAALAVVNNPLVINSGTVRITGTGANQINNADNLEVNGGTFDLNGVNEAVGGLNAAAAGGVVTNNGAASAIMYVGGSSSGVADGDYAGAIQDGASPVAFVKEGSGTQRFAGTGTYSGETGVNAGVLQVDGSISGTSQVLVTNGATLRGTGTVASPDWTINGTVQPGGDTPAATDVLTLDLSASSGTPMLFESDSTVSLVLDAGLTSSTIDVIGSAASIVAFDNNTFDFTDLTSGSLASGTYTLLDGDANTSYSLGVGVSLTGLGAYSSTSLSVSGNDLVLTIGGGGGLPGDYNEDGTVDAADYTVWRDNFGSTTPLPNDGGLGTPVGEALYTLWKTNYGNTAGAGTGAMAAAAVPEPAALSLLVIGVLLCGWRRRPV